MFKQVTKTDGIKAQIAKAYGDPDVRPDDLAVFEAVAANTLPLRRSKGIYAGARLGHDVLSGMAATINSGEHIPLQIMHRDALPVGKVFAASLQPMAGGETALHTMFYLPKKESELVGKIDSGSLNDVSVGMLPKQLLCSTCGFDYMGDEADIMNLLDCTCANGHAIGKDGVHVRVHGVKQMQELSLVNKGAAVGASILPRNRQKMGWVSTSPERLAARGVDDLIYALFAMAGEIPVSTNPSKDTPKMDELVTLKAEAIVATRDLADAKTKLDAAVAEATGLQAKLAEAEAKLADALKGDLAAAKAELAAVGEFISDWAKAALAATGKTDALPATLAEQITIVRDARAALALAIPTGGASRGAGAGTGDKNAASKSFAAFKRS